MLHVLVILLKISGFILLFFLLCILLVLITPFRYRFDLKKEEEQSVTGQARVTWFIAAVTFAAGYIDQSLEYKVRIFGFQILGNQPDFLAKKEEKQRRKAEKEKRKQEKQKKKGREEKPELSATSLERKPLKDSLTEAPPNTDTSDSKLSDEDILTDEVPKKNHSFSGKDSSKEVISKKKKSAGEKLSSIINKAKQLKAFYDNHGEELIRKTWSIAYKVLKHVFPKKLSGYLRFGFDDPAATGYAAGLLAVLYPLYGRDFSMEPDFQESCFKADCRGFGKIRPIFFLYMIIWLLMDKNIRELIHFMRHR